MVLLLDVVVVVCDRIVGVVLIVWVYVLCNGGYLRVEDGEMRWQRVWSWCVFHVLWLSCVDVVEVRPWVVVHEIRVW